MPSMNAVINNVPTHNRRSHGALKEDMVITRSV